MKFRLYFTFLLLLITLLSACTNSNNTAPVEPKNNAANSNAKLSYKISVNTEPTEIKPNENVNLSFQIQDSNGQPIGVKELDIIHEKLIHLLIVSDDLSYFDHIHPEPDAQGRFNVATKMPAPGKYHLYADYTPRGATTQIGRLPVTVVGTPPTPIPLIADSEFNKVVDNIRVVMRSDKPLQTNTPLTLSFQLNDAATNKPITDLQPYLGAFAHFVLINKEQTEFLHAHPLEEVMSPEQRGGPLVETQTSFPKPGLYKVWAQFQRNDKIIIAPFVATVVESKQAPAVIATNEGGKQTLKVVVSKDGYQPDSIQLKRGVPASITFYRNDDKNCGDEIIFTDLNIRKTLPVNQATTIEFTPDKDGKYQFTCGMGMLRGAVTVVN